MSSAYDKLRRILVLEKRQDCRDRAVFGGMDRFLEYWEKEALEEENTSEHALSVGEIMALLHDYEGMEQADRVKTVAHVLGVLSEAHVEGSSGPAREPSGIREPETPPQAQSATDAAPLASTQVRRESAAKRKEPRRESVEMGRIPAPQTGETLGSPVSSLKGVGDKNKERFARLGVRTVRDLIYHFPRRYDDFSQLKRISELEVGDEVTVVGAIENVESYRSKGGTHVTRVTLSDGTASIEITWFQQPYLQRRLRVGREIVVSGTVAQHLGKPVFSAPEWEPLQRQLLHTGRLVPVYPLTEGMRPRWLRRLVSRTVDTWAPRITDPIPADTLKAASLVPLGAALRHVHFPPDQEALRQARQRLAFDEFFLLQMGILSHRHLWQQQRGRALEIPADEIRGFVESLPFQLTSAQHRALDEILGDMGNAHPMSRLIQGDVGSGKTVVAVGAALAAVRNGLQVAIMAPTGILAEQHYCTVSRLLSRYRDIRCALLVGALGEDEKASIRKNIGEGAVHVAIGTHALIQDAVDFHRLGLVVVDEQHRFGVKQRAALRGKGSAAQPHLLTMSATPIPRSLALTVYGDLDISTLDELPAGRQRVTTVVRDSTSRERIYTFIDAQVREGRQAFIVCPLVEPDEEGNARSAVEEHQRLSEEVFPTHHVGLLHGQMPDADKESMMASVQRGDVDILVTTTVIEVGIDIPNATVMLVEGADRFGLAQLHQLRGRVGRGEHRSYCILLADDPSDESMQRLRIMEETDDGFVLAERDLEMRGAGDFIGSRQHGLPELKVASLGDVATLELAREHARRLFVADPELSAPEHQLISLAVKRFWHLELS